MATAGSSPPPPFFSIQSQQGFNNGDISQQQQHSSPSTSTTTSFSVIIVIIVIASAIIVSATIYLLLRFLSRRCHRNTFSVADDVVSSSNNVNICFNHSSNNNEMPDSLPLFTFGSLTGTVAGGDCAVCLSKFEPQDQLRLLPLCCHAFHAQCIDAWLLSNQTCPLCRSTVLPTESDIMNKIAGTGGNENSFRIEIGSISRRRGVSDSGRRSYSIGSYEYVLEDGYEVSIGSTHRRGISDCTDKDSTTTPAPEPPGESLAAEVSSGRNWLREYVDRVSLRTLSVRGGSGRFFSSSSRRSETVVPIDDIEANNRVGEEISELFRWLSGV